MSIEFPWLGHKGGTKLLYSSITRDKINTFTKDFCKVTCPSISRTMQEFRPSDPENLDLGVLGNNNNKKGESERYENCNLRLSVIVISLVLLKIQY